MIRGTFNENDSEMKPLDFTVAGDAIKLVEFSFEGGRISLIVNGLNVMLPNGSNDFVLELKGN